MNKKSKIKKWDRCIFTPKTKDYLIEYYENINKYPKRKELIVLSNKLDVNIKNIKTFFYFFRQRNHYNTYSKKSEKSEKFEKSENTQNYENNKQEIFNLIEYYKNLRIVYPLAKLPTFEHFLSLQLQLQTNVLKNQINEFNSWEKNKESGISIFDCICDAHEESVILEQFNKEDTEIIFKNMNLEYLSLENIYILSVALKKLFNSDFDYITNLNLSYIYLENSFPSQEMSSKFVSHLLEIMIENDKEYYKDESYDSIKMKILGVLENFL